MSINPTLIIGHVAFTPGQERGTIKLSKRIERNTIVHHRCTRWIATTPSTLAVHGMVPDRSVTAPAPFIRRALIAKRVCK